jgi:Fic family protein
MRELIARIGRIDEFKGAWNAGRLSGLGNDRRLALRDRAAIQSTASACRLAGRKISDDDVASLLAVPSAARMNPGTRDVPGYRALLTRVHADHARAIPFSADTIAEFHATLFAGGEPVDRTPAGSVYTGRRSSRDIGDLVEATTLALDSKRDHPLLVIARFLVAFLAKRVFAAGNGRMASALATFLLVRHGYLHVAYAPLERVVEDYEADYRAALEQSLKDLRRSPIAFGPWAVFVLTALQMQQLRAGEVVDGERGQLRLSGLRQRLVDFIRDNGRVTTTTLAARFDMPPRTLRYHLRTLVDQGFVEAHGDDRGRHYTLPTTTAIDETAM